MKRVLRVGVLAFSLVGLLGFHAQPASASEVIEVTFQGTAFIGAGYSAFGFPVGDPSKTTLPTTSTKIEHGVPLVNHHNFHNSTTVRFVSAAVGGCVAEKVTTGKAKHPTGAGTCSLVADGFIHGYCGLSTGTVHGTIHTSLNSGLTHTTQSYSFSVKFTVDGPDVTLTGAIHNHTSGQSGSIIAEAVSGLLSQGSCTDKNPKTAPIVGEATATTT